MKVEEAMSRIDNGCRVICMVKVTKTSVIGVKADEASVTKQLDTLEENDINAMYVEAVNTLYIGA